MPDPVSAAARLIHRRGRVLLRVGEWSFVSAEPRATLIARGHSLLRLDEYGRPAKRFTGDPFDAAEAFLHEHGCVRAPRGLGPPEVRVIGYFSYDLARVVTQLSSGPSVGNDGPDLWLGAYGAVARWRDPGTDAGTVVGTDRAWLEAALQKGPREVGQPPELGPLVPDDDGAHHIARVDRARDHLAAGDLSRIYLARRFSARVQVPGDALALSRALTAASPDPYSGLIEADGATLVATSSEPFPIADADAFGHEQIASADADHRADGYAALLRATFPATTIIGAPKVRAMELIDELEPARRGPFGGAFGYFGADGACELGLSTRIGVFVANELRVRVGGEVVASTDAAALVAETEREARTWIEILDALDRTS